MAYDNSKPFSYGIPNGTYTGRPTTASCYEHKGRLVIDINFAVKNPNNGEYFKKTNGYEWEAKKRFWITSQDGAFNAATIDGIKEWAKGWEPRSFEDFYWFQADGFANLQAIGEVELNFQTNQKTGAQDLWVHDPNRAKGRKVFVPDGAQADKSALMAKWGAKAKALFASAPKKVAPAQTAKIPAQSAPDPAGTVAPVRPSAPAQAPSAKPWESFPQTPDGAFLYYQSLVGEPYSSEKHDGKWFEIFDAAAQGKDPDEFAREDTQRLFKAVAEAMAK